MADFTERNEHEYEHNDDEWETEVVGRLSLKFDANSLPRIDEMVEKARRRRVSGGGGGEARAPAAQEAAQGAGQAAHGGARAVQVVAPGPEHSFQLDEAALARLLLDERVRDRHAVVVSVAGAFRKGKSFLLDFFLRYMYAKYGEESDGSGGGGGGAGAGAVAGGEWLGEQQRPLEGFSWRGGSERDTTGILVWSHVFTTTLHNGEQVAILLLDTQGAFDSESTVRDCATVFALSTMLSSVQIYNLSQNIQEDDLQHLQLFTEYGRLALEEGGRTPFQRLQFLVRDWSFPYEAPYGPDGGRQLLQKRLKVSEKQHPELQSLRRHITSCFSEIACFLMPHPGLNVATNPQFDGRLADIEQEFKRSLGQLVPMVLAPQNLVPKEINGQRVKCKELLHYFKCYMNIYRGNTLPEPKSMLHATAEANNLTAVAEARETYTLLMEEVCGGARPYLHQQLLAAEHERVRDKALHVFAAKRKMGGDEFSAAYRAQLLRDLDEQFAQFAAHNESKNIFKAARTPSVYFAVAMLFYVLSGVLGLLGLYPLANLASLAMGVALLTLVLWAYIRYSGEMREFGVSIDDTANVLWDNVMKPAYKLCVEKGLEQAAHAAAERALGDTSAAPAAPAPGAAPARAHNGKQKQL